MKKIFLVFVLALTACSAAPKEKITGLSSLNKSSNVIGVPDGFAAAEQISQHLPNAKIEYFSLLPIEAIEKNKIDGFVFDRFSCDYIAEANNNLAVLEESIGNLNICIGAAKENDLLLNQINEFIEKYKKDGTADDMYKRWVTEKNHKMPEIEPAANPTEKLKIITNGMTEPMNFYSGTKLIGYDMEFTERFAKEYNYGFEYVIMDFPAMPTALQAGKGDLIISNLFYSKERAEIIEYSNTYITTELTLLVNKDRLAQ